MKMDADEKALLESVERGEWKAAKGIKRARGRYSPLREGHVPQGAAAEHPAVQQGLGGNSEAGAGGGLAVSDADLKPAAQVRIRPPQGGLKRGRATSEIEKPSPNYHRSRASWLRGAL